MTFLFPGAAALLALAIPIIGFYLIRTRLERRTVSTLLFWDPLAVSAYQTALWRRLRRWLSLLLQLLLLALLVLALSQPLPPWQTPEPASTVFVLDGSASMLAREGKGKPSRWESGRELVRSRIAQLRPFDRMAILESGNPPRILSGWTSSRRTLDEALKTAVATGDGSGIASAVDLARQIASTQKGTRIEIVSDRVWPDAFKAGNEVSVTTVGRPAPNVGITAFSGRRSPAQPGEIALSGEVASTGAATSPLSVELHRDGRLIDVQSVVFEAGKPWRHEWTVRSDDAAKFELRLTELFDDALDVDNAAALEIGPLTTIPVLLVSDPEPFLEAALESLPRVAWRRVGASEVPADPEPGSLTIFRKTAAPDAYAAAPILLLNPSDPGFWGTPLGAVDRPLVSEFDKNSPLLRHTAMASIRLDSATKWKPAAGATVSAESFGDPLFFGRWEAGSDPRRWLLLAFDLDSSDLVLRTTFPILLGNVVDSLRPSVSPAVNRAPGVVETLLVAASADATDTAAQPAAAAPVWAFLPLWWWAVMVAAALFAVEWSLFNRRITE